MSVPLSSAPDIAVRDDAPRVPDEQADAARVFEEFLLEPEQQEALVRRGLRPIIRDVLLRPPIDHSHGAEPAATLVYPETTQPMLDQIAGV